MHFSRPEAIPCWVEYRGYLVMIPNANLLGISQTLRQKLKTREIELRMEGRKHFYGC